MGALAPKKVSDTCNRAKRKTEDLDEVKEIMVKFVKVLENAQKL